MDFGKLKKGLGAAKDKAADTANTISEKGKEQMNKQVPAMLEKLSALRPILKESGFIVDEVGITISIPPTLSLTVTQEEGAENKIKEVIESHELTKFQKVTLNSIAKMYGFNQTFGKFNYVIGDLEIEMSIPPAVTAHLKTKDS
jgi:hypothetical protein